MTLHSIGPVLINGVPKQPHEAAISVFDIGFQRGYGCFEAMRSYGGFLFRLEDHITRLAGSASHLRIELPPADTITGWCQSASGAADGVLRIFVTGGTNAKQPGTDSAVVVFLEPLPPVPDSISLDILDAPWHADGRQSELTGAKTLSYGPNLAATIEARLRGFDDAALLGSGEVVLEGPTFSLAWVANGAMCTPGLEQHILASITREATIEVANAHDIEVREERFVRRDLVDADEVFIMSTVREILPVVAVGDSSFQPGPVTEALRSGFHKLVASEAR